MKSDKDKKKISDLEDRVAELSDLINILIGRIALLENQINN